MAKSASESDKKILLNPKNTRIILNLMAEALVNLKGVSHVTRLYSKSWGFDLKEIPKTVKFFLWHGEQDMSVPVSMAKKFCQNLPNCTGKFLEGEGHFSTFVNHFEEIINTLIA
jgi:pimeloyl-ACP methyl ester carboxylesterase